MVLIDCAVSMSISEDYEMRMKYYIPNIAPKRATAQTTELKL
jgi:hypothetical protein